MFLFNFKQVLFSPKKIIKMCKCKNKINCKCQQITCCTSQIIINQPAPIQPTYKWQPKCCCENNNNNGGINNLLLGALIAGRNNNNIGGFGVGIGGDVGIGRGGNRYDYGDDYGGYHKHHHHHKHHCHENYYSDRFPRIIYAIPPPYYPGPSPLYPGPLY